MTLHKQMCTLCCFKVYDGLLQETGYISEHLFCMAYFRETVGLSTLNEAIMKLESEIQNLVEAGESF
jgi:hypothetical protein